LLEEFVVRNRFFACVALLALSPSMTVAGVFINEIDYDNVGTDASEWIELVGNAGISLNNYELAFYNGNDAALYATFDLAGANFTFADETNGWGFFVIGIVHSAFGVSADYTPLGWTTNVIQNGAPDAVQLRLKSPVTNIHLIEYEGDNLSIPADQNTPLGDNNNDVGTTLYLTGSGNDFSDFTFAVNMNAGTPGLLNAGQTLVAIPEASAFLLGGLVCGVLGLAISWRRGTK